MRRKKEIMGKYHALDIAKWFICRNQYAEEAEGADQMSLLKVLKLLYYAEGCSLALDRGSLFDEPIEAWAHGPVVKNVWEYYKDDSYHLKVESPSVSIDPQDRDLLENVFQTFGQYSAWGLRNLTHSESPWLNATNNGRVLNKEISRNDMKNYFKKHYVE